MASAGIRRLCFAAVRFDTLRINQKMSKESETLSEISRI